MHPTLLQDLKDFFFPRKCPVCGGRLYNGEWICTYCLSRLPHTLYHRQKENKLEQRLKSIAPIERATGYFFYSPQGDYSSLLHQIKYYNHQPLAIHLGKLMATHLISDGDFFEGINFLVPIPLAHNRLRQRGYNQSLLLAQGIHEVTHIPISSNTLLRIVDNPSQTHLTNTERWKNVKDIFSVTPTTFEQFNDKHILLVDDVATTGATLSSCIQTISKAVPTCRISVVVLAIADIDF
ncbi:MAG: ComF family protein [Bacteroidaceae bacterium]|nr:ComF family protein [Bacteroidaceae bacterium]